MFGVIFVLLTAVVVLTWFPKKSNALWVLCISFILSVGFFIYHLSNTINIDL